MNKYLVKIAEDKSSKKEIATAAGLSAGGGALIRNATPSLAGYKVLYHGTTKDNAKSILRDGFDPSFGGKNNAAATEFFKHMSQGKNHFSGSKSVSKVFSSSKVRDFFKSETPSGVAATKHVLNTILNPFSKTDGTVLKVRVPRGVYEKSFKPDPTTGFGQTNRFGKHIASTYDQKIDPKFIAGAPSSTGAGQFLKNPSYLKRALKTSGGRLAFGTGISKALVGATMIGSGVKKVQNQVSKRVNGEGDSN